MQTKKQKEDSQFNLIRYGIGKNGPIKTPAEKLSLLLQAVLGFVEYPSKFGFEINRIFSSAPKLAKFLVDLVVRNGTASFATVSSCVKVAASVNSKCWWDSKNVTGLAQ